MKEIFRGLVITLKIRYYVVFRYACKKTGYILLKTLCLIIFLIPFIITELVDFIIETLLAIPSIIPIIGIPAKLACLIFGAICSIFFTLLAIADVIYNTENQKILENYTNTYS